MTEPTDDREPASSPCQAPPGYWGEDEAPPLTECEWLACPDPLRMLEFLRYAGTATDRKLRLFAVACSRRARDRADALGRAAADVAEAFADGEAGAAALRAARLACRSAGPSAAWYAAATDPHVAARNAALSAQSGNPGEGPAQAELLRDVFGNVFRPPAFDDAWRTPEVVALARNIYDERRFADLPALAEALRRAGCGEEEILRHCREQGRSHTRGCWVVDLVLGRG